MGEQPQAQDSGAAAADAALDRLADGARQAVGAGRREPRDCGHFDITIARDGSWFYRGTPINRAALVRLFSTVLHRDEAGAYWLITPAERGRITVEDTPFVAVELNVAGEGRQRALTFRTNVDDTVALDEAHPLRVETDSVTGEPHPSIEVRNGLAARIARPVFYELVDLGEEERVGDATLLGVWSKGRFFPLGSLEEGR
jgi:hypothetical protein